MMPRAAAALLLWLAGRGKAAPVEAVFYRRSDESCREPRPLTWSSPRRGEEAKLYALRRLRCTSSNEIAAGVTPPMRAAWPSVAGWVRLSLVSTSVESPRTLS